MQDSRKQRRSETLIADKWVEDDGKEARARALDLRQNSLPTGNGRRKVVRARIRNSRGVFAFANVADLIRGIGRRLRKKDGTPPAHILIYPGKFDPFHKTHLQELQGALDKTEVQRAVVIPTPGPPGTGNNKRSPSWLRMLLIQTSTKDDDRIRVDNFGLVRLPDNGMVGRSFQLKTSNYRAEVDLSIKL